MRRSHFSTSAVLRSLPESRETLHSADFQAIQLEDRTLLDATQTPTDPTQTTAPTTPQVTQTANPQARALTGALASSLLHLSPGMNYTLPGWLGSAPTSGTQRDVYFAADVDYQTYMAAHPGQPSATFRALNFRQFLNH